MIFGAVFYFRFHNSAQAQNLIQNPGFEQIENVDVPGWGAVPLAAHWHFPIDIDVGANGPSEGFARSGAYSLFMGCVVASCITEQTVNGLRSGATYRLSFWLATDPGEPSSFVAKFGSPGAQRTLLNLATSEPGFAYTKYTYTVRADASSQLLTFDALQVPAWWYLDDVELIQLGPNAANTQSMVYRNAFDVRSALTHRTSVLSYALDYDCGVFDRNNMCVSYGGRYGNTGNGIEDGAGILALAYRFLPQFYAGAFVDQAPPLSYGTTISPKGSDPTYGGFLVYQAHQNNTGLRVRVSAVRNTNSVRITRETLLSDTEPGTGKTQLKSAGYGADISYGFALDAATQIAPYAAIRRTTARRQGYGEETSNDVVYPITYQHMDRELTTASAGIRGFHRLDNQIRLTAAAGAEYDVKTTQDSMSGTSSIAYFEAFSLAPATRKTNRTRGLGSLGAQIPITSNAVFAVNSSLRQQAYTSDLSLAIMASVMVGF